jgi:putative ABC transport system ATP-binding protein
MIDIDASTVAPEGSDRIRSDIRPMKTVAGHARTYERAPDLTGRPTKFHGIQNVLSRATATTSSSAGVEKLLGIEMADVVREYRAGGQRVRALDGLTLRINGGQFTSIVGPSGAGKSTLLHLLGALDSPDSGSIRFDGVEIATMTDDQQAKFRRRKVGFIFQFFNLLPTLTAWENVAIPKVLDGQDLRKVRPCAIRLLKLVGLGNRMGHRPAELSGGQMQRVAVARALMMDPPLILADEPTGNLDSATGAAILELLQSVAHDVGVRRAVVMVTHNLEAAAETDRVITLQDGALRSDVLTSDAPRGGRHAAGRLHSAASDVGVRVHNGGPRSELFIANSLQAWPHSANPV